MVGARTAEILPTAPDAGHCCIAAFAATPDTGQRKIWVNLIMFSLLIKCAFEGGGRLNGETANIGTMYTVGV